MLPDHASLKQIHHTLLQELRKDYPESESTSMLRLILDHTGYPSPIYLVEPEQIPGPSTIAQINEIVSEIHTGKPLQYILGYTHFLDLRIKVNNKVLIPRPETEEMVVRIMEYFKEPPERILDIGTGSGCIALALKQRYGTSIVTALDADQEALKVAGENGYSHGLQVEWVLHDILRPDHHNRFGSFDLVVSNPPYVLESERDRMNLNVLGFEPAMALFVRDSDPFCFVRAIGTFCSDHLEKGGMLCLEINEQLGPESLSILKGTGFRNVKLMKDIHDKPRYIFAGY